MARIRRRSPGVLAACVLSVALALAGAPRAAAADGAGGGAGSVSGVVTAGGVPLAAAWVVVTPVTASGDWAGRPMQVATSGNGRYAVEGIAVEHVKVHVRSPLTGDYVATFWPGVYSFGQAGTIPVTPDGSVADIDLPLGRSIEGQVVAADTGEPVEGAQLVARIADAPWAEPAGRFEPGAGPGMFEISGLPPVPIRLHVQVPPGSPFLGDGYRPDGTERGRRVEGPGDVTGLVIRLPRGGEVSGTVTDGQGRPVAGAQVRIDNCEYGCPRQETTDASGAYRIRGIPPSPRVIAHAWAPDAIDQWYDHAREWVTATPFALGPGEVRAEVDFELVRGGVLAATVIAGDTGLPLVGVSAYLQSIAAPVRRYFAESAESAPAGYRIGPVPPETYRLVLVPSPRQSRYRPARWLSFSGIAASGLIHLDPGQEVEVVVRLAPAGAGAPTATPAATPNALPNTPAQCVARAGAWLGLFRGFLGDDLWPWPSPCRAIRECRGPPSRAQRD